MSSGKISPPSAFFALPSEIRNQIYGCVFVARRVLVFRAERKPAADGRRYGARKLEHTVLDPRVPFTTDTTARDCKTVEFSPLLVCRQMHDEAFIMFYASIQFRFERTKAIQRFLDQTNEAAKRVIHHLEIQACGYGEPLLSEFRGIKKRNDGHWLSICNEIRVSFKLKALYVVLEVHDWPVKLELTDDWAAGLFCFIGIGIEYAVITVHIHDARLPRVRELEKILELMIEGKE